MSPEAGGSRASLVEMGARLLFVIGGIALFWIARERNDDVVRGLAEGARRAGELAFLSWPWVSVLLLFAAGGLVFGLAVRLPVGGGYAWGRATVVGALPALGIVLSFVAFEVAGSPDHPLRFLSGASGLLQPGMQPLYAILLGLAAAAGAGDLLPEPSGDAPGPHA